MNTNDTQQSPAVTTATATQPKRRSMLKKVLWIICGGLVVLGLIGNLIKETPYEGQYYANSGGGEWNVSIEGDSKITGVFVTGNSFLSYVGETKSVSKVDENTYEIKATATSQLKSPTMGDMITENIPVVCRWHKGQNGEPDSIDYAYGENEAKSVHLTRAKKD